MEFRNARYLKDGRIDCEVNHPQLGWIPFTASIDDPDAKGRRVFVSIVEAGAAEAYTPPPAPSHDELMSVWREKASCSMLSLQDHLIDIGLFEGAEAASQNIDPKWRIRWEARGGVDVSRSNPLLDQFAGMIGLTSDQVDAMPIWRPVKPEVV